MPFEYEVTDQNIEEVEKTIMAASDTIESIQANIEAYDNLESDEDPSDADEEEKEKILQSIQEDLSLLCETINERFMSK